MSQTSPEVVVVDFGMGNVRSVLRALHRVGARGRDSADAAEVLGADRVILPGVGHLADCVKALDERGLSEALRERIRRARPYLGICLGLQILLSEGEEGGARGLGLVEGQVARFPDRPDLPVPHMGWNEVRCLRPHPVVGGGYYYFVHGYRAVGIPDEVLIGVTDYGGDFASAIGFDACLGVQFHPEKSQRDGLALLEGFCRWAP